MSEKRAEFEKWLTQTPWPFIREPIDKLCWEAWQAGKRAGDRELVEALRLLPDLLTNVAQILDVVKGEWGETWSDWDQEQRDRITACLLALREKEGE
jgi:hypothetical protein